MIRSTLQRRALPITSGSENLLILWLGTFSGIVTGCVAATSSDGQTECHVSLDRLYVMCVLQAASTNNSGCYQTFSAANKAAIAALCSKLRTEQHCAAKACL
jgi:hypothetical protein